MIQLHSVKVTSDKKLWADCTKCPQTFNTVRNIILTVSKLQFYIRSRQATTLHAISYCMICIYSRLQCQEGDCRTLACDVVLFVWWLVRLHGDLPDSRHPAVSCQSYRTWQLTDFANPEWIHPLWSILQSFRTGCTGCKVIAHSALFSL